MPRTEGSDFSVFAIMPHANTIHPQLLRDGDLVKSSSGVTITYEAVADSTGSINTTSAGKGNFWDHVEALYGESKEVDEGLSGQRMPGPENTPQSMIFDTSFNRFTAHEIPITPYDDSGSKNYFPMMRLVARNDSGQELASTDIALPVSDEINCRACHGSGTSEEAAPAAGWIWDCDPDRDSKLNILLRHDEKNAGPRYKAQLNQAGYLPEGLFATVVEGGTPVLCTRCHASSIREGSGLDGIPSLSSTVHSQHA